MHKVRLKHFLNMWIGAKSLLICEGLLIDKNVCVYIYIVSYIIIIISQYHDDFDIVYYQL